MDRGDDQEDGGLFRPYQTVGRAMALVILAVAIKEWLRNFGQPDVRDFIAFWGAARLTLAGTPALVYDSATLHAVQNAVAAFNDGVMPYPYPPATLLLVAPFGLLPYAVALPLWAAGTFMLYWRVVQRLYPGTGWLAASAPAVFANAALGQNGFILAAIFMAGLAAIPARPFRAGVMLGCLIVKPQLALMLPVAVLAARQWSAVAGAVVGVAAVLLAGLILCGAQATLGWFHLMTAYPAIARDGVVGWEKVASIYGTVRELGGSASAAFALHGIAAAAAAVAVWRIWRSDASPRCRIAILGAASLLASPYLYIYDTLIAVPACFWLVERRLAPGWIAALWFLPLLAIVQTARGPGLLNLNAIAPIALVALVYAQWVRAQSPEAARAGDDGELSAVGVVGI